MINSEIQYIIIRRSKIIRNGVTIFQKDDETETSEFLKSAYKSFELDYSKFFKMDRLSKLGFLATELLFPKGLPNNTALIFGNSNSSLDTDIEYFKTMNSYPSPGLFVYTLPNIMLGEISIRHQLLSENTFFISEKFDASLFLDYAESLMLQENNLSVLCGWVDLHSNDYDVFLWHIASLEDLISQREQILNIYLPTNE